MNSLTKNFLKIQIVLLINLFCFLVNISNAQVKIYRISGEFKSIKTGKIYLMPIDIDRKYYEKNYGIDSANINEGKFSINRKIYGRNIYPYRIVVRSNLINGMTNLIFIAPKNQMILIDSLNEFVSPVIENSLVQYEMKYQFDVFFKKLVCDIMELEVYSESLYGMHQKDISEIEQLELTTRRNVLSERADSLFFEYAKVHPNSYVTLWKLIERFKFNGFKTKYLDMYNLLSENLKKNASAIHLLNELNTTGILATGNIFPTLKLQTEDSKTIFFEAKNHKATFILIDFWYSNCSPCLKEFYKLKKLYDENRIFGFEIIGISVDKRENLINLKKTIKKNGLNWINYWDINGTISEKIGINYFPTNFLIDSKGAIIQKNISVEELTNFFDLKFQPIYNNDNPNEPN